MGFYIWTKQAEQLDGPKDCEYCDKKIKIGDKYYILSSQPFITVHALCYWEATEKGPEDRRA